MARSSGVKPALFLNVKVAPRSARNFTTGSPRPTAPWIAVPLERRTLETRIWIGTAVEEQLHHIDAIEFVGENWRRPALHPLQAVHVHGRIQRAHAGDVHDVGIGALFEQYRGQVVMRIDDGEDQSRRPDALLCSLEFLGLQRD